MNYTTYPKLAAMALGRKKAPLVFKNAKVLNVFSEELIKADVAVADGTIVGVGSYEGEREIDLAGRFLVPGFIDAHLHLESTLVLPHELIGAAVQKGTTAFIVDPHEAANVAGGAGINYLMDATAGLPANVYFMMPSCVPAAEGEDNGCRLDAAEMSAYLDNPRILGLGELMDYTAVIEGKPGMMDKLALFAEKVKDGHAIGLDEKQLAAYALAGIVSDHECSDYDHAMRELRNGMQVLIREGSGARNLEDIVRGIVANNIPTEYFSFCTDDKHIEHILGEGHISHNIRKSIKLGIKAAKAYKMASINTARLYGLRQLGAIAPGFQADFVVLDDFEAVSVAEVYHKGELAKPTAAPVPCPPELLNTVRVAKIEPRMLDYPAGPDPLAVINIQAGQITTRREYAVLPSENGLFRPNSTYNKAVVVERHKASGKLGIAAVSGFGIRGGAIAASVSHDSHNITAVGDNDGDILVAIEELKRMQGGYVIVEQGKLAKALPLPIMGLMSDLGPDKVEEILSEMRAKAVQMGVPAGVDPLILLSFLALPVIPEIRVSTRGIIHVTPE